ncbi:MAG: hypothetical protein J5503_04815, partial [Muribaculaceae bacterium]|nr:hypothetical protein [Muribaculaceae bacterium]
MDMSIEKMLSHVYEIEGLMLVTRRLGEENTPDVITNKIQRKVRELAEMCGVTLPSAPQEPCTPPQAPEPPEFPENSENTEILEPTENSETSEDTETVEVPTPPEHLPDEDYDADETWQHDNGEEFKEVFSLNYEEPRLDVVDPHQVPVEDREPDDDITLEFIEAPEEDEPVLETPTPPAAPVEEPSVVETPAAEAPV